VKRVRAEAPNRGGAPAGWRRYQSLVLREPVGLAREREPVECSLTVRAEDCADLERELRLFTLDADEWIPVPVQTCNAKFYPGRPPGTTSPNYLQHPSRSIEAVFLASVPARGSRIYLFLYDASAASPPEMPEMIESDLSIEGPALGAVVENAHYVVDLDDKSGQIASFIIKGRTSPAPKLTNSHSFAAHWNPDSFADNGQWGHTFAWDPPDETVVGARGPILFRVTNSGRMPERTPQVHASVNYSFFSGVPYIKATTITEVRDELNASAIRNGELVLDSHLITHFVWQERNGELRMLPTLHGPNWQDEWATRVDHDAPWLAMTNEPENYGVAEIVESSIGFNAHRGEATMHRPAFYLYYHHFWNIPVTYFTRGWVYPFSDYQRGPILVVDKGSTYVEKMAFLPATLGDGDRRYHAFVDAAVALRNPLVQRWGR
jgi:hypothetical protein